MAMALKPEDHQLSMLISPRGKIPTEDLRSLLVHRLSDTYKAVLRRSLGRERLAVYCEDCKAWQQVSSFPVQWTCRYCKTSYRIEFAVYEEMEPEGEDRGAAAGGHEPSD